jgi:hypothetical protein
MNTVVNSQQINSLVHASFSGIDSVLVVCASNDQALQESMLNYLYEAGYTSLTVTTVADCGNDQVKALLARDASIGLISFVILKDGVLRHYFRTAGATDFSIRVATIPAKL